jgi:hypothetical protein
MNCRSLQRTDGSEFGSLSFSQIPSAKAQSRLVDSGRSLKRTAIHKNPLTVSWNLGNPESELRSTFLTHERVTLTRPVNPQSQIPNPNSGDGFSAGEGPDSRFPDLLPAIFRPCTETPLFMHPWLYRSSRVTLTSERSRFALMQAGRLRSSPRVTLTRP